MMKPYEASTIEKKQRYLQLLAKQYPTIDAVSTEIIHLQALLNLPKPTEHFLSDIHGEYEPFKHVLKNASGVIKQKIEEIFQDTLSTKEKRSLATLIYYPEQKLQQILEQEDHIERWYTATLYSLIKVCREVSSKYTRAKVREALPKDFSHIIEELLHEEQNSTNKQDYYEGIIQTIIDIDKAKEFICELCKLIQRFAVDRLHIVGDIFDRGPRADIILDTLMEYHSVDIQWGNHDILWMGAAAGSEACIATVLRSCIRYGNLKTLELGYGINTLPLATFAMEFYGEDPCEIFYPKLSNQQQYSAKEMHLFKQMHKAITILLLKLEGQIIKRNPEFNLNDRLLLEKIDYEKGSIFLEGKEYRLEDRNFPTIDPDQPYELTPEEKELIDKLNSSFLNSYKLQKHMNFLYAKGSMYLTYNSNLLYHGCIPMNEDGSLKKVQIEKKEYCGKELIDKAEQIAREAYREGYFHKIDPQQKQFGLDYMWYLWTGPDSPLFGKSKMATFERYFIEDAKTHKEHLNPYYSFRNDEKVCESILRAFDLEPETSHIINGHVPVKYKEGESPIKANGKLVSIDGGFSKAYQKITGIAGYTLISTSNSMFLAAHGYFESTQKAIEEEEDIISSIVVLENNRDRKRVKDTDTGKELLHQLEDLKMLLTAYRTGMIKEQ